MASPPPPPTTVRRNPPRLARPLPTPLRSAKPKSPSSPACSTKLQLPTPSFPLFLQLPLAQPPPPPPPPLPSSSSQLQEEGLKVYLRIRPLPVPERERCKPSSRPKAKEPRKLKQLGGGVCLVATGANSVALTVPQSKLVDNKRGRTATEHDIFNQVMNPLVDEFLRGKSGLLVAMGPTGSGKTHTIFGTPRNPGIVPLTLQKIFNATDESEGGNQPTRSFCLSMFEILCEGKGERNLDLLSDAADLVLRQSTAIKGLKEVP